MTFVVVVQGLDGWPTNLIAPRLLHKWLSSTCRVEFLFCFPPAMHLQQYYQSLAHEFALNGEKSHMPIFARDLAVASGNGPVKKYTLARADALRDL